MKRIFIFLIGVMMVMPSFAGPDDTDEICRRNTLVMAVLQKEKNGTVRYLNNDKKRWIVNFDYDIFANMRPGITAYDIYGSATCNGIAVRSSPDGKSNSDGDANPGDVNTYLKASPRDVGPNCWCKMDGPVTRHGGHISKNILTKANAKRTVRHIVQTVLQTIQQLRLIKMVAMRYFTQFGNGGNHAENIYNFMLFGGYVCTRHRNVRPK